VDDFYLLCGQLGYIIIKVRNYERHLQISDRFTHVRITSSSKPSYLQALYRLPQAHSGVSVSDYWCEVRGESVPIYRSGNWSKAERGWSWRYVMGRGYMLMKKGCSEAKVSQFCMFLRLKFWGVSFRKVLRRCTYKRWCSHTGDVSFCNVLSLTPCGRSNYRGLLLYRSECFVWCLWNVKLPLNFRHRSHTSFTVSADIIYPFTAPPFSYLHSEWQMRCDDKRKNIFGTQRS
jgi:hypothetical protein